MKINKLLTPYNKWDGRRGDHVEWIVLHYTANTWQPDLAKNEAAEFAKKYVGASAHFFVDQTSVWQSVEVKDTAWHVGDAPSKNGCHNTNSIGIEMCVIYKDGIYSIPDETVDNAVALVRELLVEFPNAQLCRHYDVTGKKCPQPWVNNPALWEDFLNKVRKDDEMTPEEKKEFERLEKKVATLEEKMKSFEDFEQVMGRDVAKIDKRTEVKYDRVEDCPDWLQPTIQKLVDRGYLKGDKNGNLGLTQDMARILVIIDRAGAFD